MGRNTGHYKGLGSIHSERKRETGDGALKQDKILGKT